MALTTPEATEDTAPTSPQSADDDGTTPASTDRAATDSAASNGAASESIATGTASTEPGAADRAVTGSAEPDPATGDLARGVPAGAGAASGPDDAAAGSVPQGDVPATAAALPAPPATVRQIMPRGDTQTVPGGTDAAASVALPALPEAEDFDGAASARIDAEADTGDGLDEAPIRATAMMPAEEPGEDALPPRDVAVPAEGAAKDIPSADAPGAGLAADEIARGTTAPLSADESGTAATVRGERGGVPEESAAPGKLSADVAAVVAVPDTPTGADMPLGEAPGAGETSPGAGGAELGADRSASEIPAAVGDEAPDANVGGEVGMPAAEVPASDSVGAPTPVAGASTAEDPVSGTAGVPGEVVAPDAGGPGAEETRSVAVVTVPGPDFSEWPEGALDQPTPQPGREGRFLPLPFNSPPVVPQQEAPGVVVSAVSPFGGGPRQSIIEQRPNGDTVTLADYAYGAYQRGLYNTAFRVALRAAAADQASAAALIGRLYEEANGVEQDFAKAAGWYAVAADQGDLDAQTRLAGMLLMGRGVPRDSVRAAAAFRRAAAAGSADAAHSLALMLIKGEGVEADLSEALRYMRQAAEGGKMQAQYALAVMYEEGRGTLPNDAEATYWYGRAAESGDPAAMLTYATRIFSGIGAPADEAAAAYYLGAAARLGIPSAMNRFARVLANGRGIASDPVEAIKWHLVAREAGVSDFYLDGYMGAASARDVAEARRRAALFVRR
ncbi:SEL1-like repeat protein [Acuticoccus yangtzensis]|uniref:SEL1-like repeat protein n=1 Tax=Acuticoccus yangtzensis TaxID=1443441 RepID=UPI000949621C|nr:SEL1-like repeat protein [Acuticoccus yangtzensis]